MQHACGLLLSFVVCCIIVKQEQRESLTYISLCGLQLLERGNRVVATARNPKGSSALQDLLQSMALL